MITCQVCQMPVPESEITPYAFVGGLPQFTCKLCFEVNDYSINSVEELAAKSLQRRAAIIMTNPIDPTYRKAY